MFSVLLGINCYYEKHRKHEYKPCRSGKEYAAKLTAARKLTRLAKIEGYGVTAAVKRTVKIAYPADVHLRKLVNAADCTDLVVKFGFDILIANEPRENVVTSGSEARVIQSVNIFGNAADSHAELIAAILVKLHIASEEFLVYSSAHARNRLSIVCF